MKEPNKWSLGKPQGRQNGVIATTRLNDVGSRSDFVDMCHQANTDTFQLGKDRTGMRRKNDDLVPVSNQFDAQISREEFDTGPFR